MSRQEPDWNSKVWSSLAVTPGNWIASLLKPSAEFVSPRRAAWPAALVSHEIPGHESNEIGAAGTFGGPDRFPFPRDSFPALTELGQRHRHHVVELRGPRLLRAEILHQLHGGASVSHAVVGNGGEQTDQGVGEHEVIGVALHPCHQAVASQLVPLEAD